MAAGEDFSDRAGRGVAITVRMARTFITNYFRGNAAVGSDFERTDTTPVLSPSGQIDEAWDALRDGTPGLWDDADLQRAGREFSRLIQAQRRAFEGRNPKPPVDRPEKAMNAAVLSAWAYVAGLLSGNEVRLTRHYALSDTAGRDPLNAVELSRARHRTDPDTYRGLGFEPIRKNVAGWSNCSLFKLRMVPGSLGAGLNWLLPNTMRSRRSWK